MSYTEPKPKNENDKRQNLDEVVEDEFNLSVKKKPLNDSVDPPKPKKINLNEDI